MSFEKPRKRSDLPTTPETLRKIHGHVFAATTQIDMHCPTP